MTYDLDFYNMAAGMTDTQLKQMFGTRDYYIYELDFLAVAPAGTPQSSFTIQADSNFIWQYGCYWADIAAATETNNTRVLPNITTMIQDTGSGRQLASNPVPVPSQFGWGQDVYELPTPRLFMANSQVTVNLVNFDAAVTYNLRLQFIGTKLYKFGTQ